MANEGQLSILKQGVEVWNKWRADNSRGENGGTWPQKFTGIKPDLSNADLSNSNLGGADLSWANLMDKSIKQRTNSSVAIASQKSIFENA